MLAAFLHFDEGVVFVLGITPKDIALMTNGVQAPDIDLTGLAAEFGSPPPTRLQVIFGPTEEMIQEQIASALEDGEGEVTHHDVDPDLVEQYMQQSQITPGHVAANAAEELAIKKARAKLN